MVTIICIMLFGSVVENSGMSTFKTGILYIGSGAGGYLFKCACNDTLAVGGIAGVFGFLAALASNLILNWKAIHQLGGARYCFLVCNVVLMGLVLMVTYAPEI